MYIDVVKLSLTNLTGDGIIRINGKLATSVAFVKKVLAEAPGGEPVALEIRREKGVVTAESDGTELANQSNLPVPLSQAGSEEIPTVQGMIMPQTISNPEMTAPGINFAMLKELKDLLDAGILTQTEFDAQKKMALGTLAT